MNIIASISAALTPALIALRTARTYLKPSPPERRLNELDEDPQGQGVLDLLLEADVAAADRDRLELRLRMEQSDQERGDVVARGVGVDDQTNHARSR